MGDTSVPGLSIRKPGGFPGPRGLTSVPGREGWDAMRRLIAWTLLVTLVSCGGSGEGAGQGSVQDTTTDTVPDPGPGVPPGPGGNPATVPNLRVFLSDSPVDEADAVYILIDRVEAVRVEDGEETFDVINDEDQEVELLALRDDVTAVIGETTLDPGSYAGLRLIVVDGKPGGGPPPRPVGPNRIVIGGEEYRLTIPSGSQSGIKLLDPFTIEEGKLTELFIDFNVRHSIVKLGKKDEYHLKPRLTLVESKVRGAIDGTATDADTGDPIEGASLSAQVSGDEVVSALSRADGTYRLGPVSPATYDVVASADGYAPAVIENVAVPTGTIVAGKDFALEPSDTGSISGTTVTDEGAEVRLVWQGYLLATVGPDPDTGEFFFDPVAVGTYDVVLIVGDTEVDRIEDVEVTAGTDTGSLELGLP